MQPLHPHRCREPYSGLGLLRPLVSESNTSVKPVSVVRSSLSWSSWSPLSTYLLTDALVQLLLLLFLPVRPSCSSQA